MSKSYSTGDVALLCRVVPRTVVKWYENEGLKGSRGTANGRDERIIPRENLLNFLAAQGTPLDHTFFNHANHVLLLSHHSLLVDALKQFLTGAPCRVLGMTDPFAIGEFVQEALGNFCWAVVDRTCRTFNADRICQTLIDRQWRIIALANRKQPVIEGITETFYFPFHTSLLATRLRSLIDD